MRVLELGGGFGELARYLAAEHDCEVVSYNISADRSSTPASFARACRWSFVSRTTARRPRNRDYDRVVSVGLMEHVGPKNYRGFFELASARLKAGGLALIHTIGGNQSAAPVPIAGSQVHLPRRRHPLESRSSPVPRKACSCSRTGTTSAPTTTAR
jgi:cyclopropane fatty-acyl-phospholipid synthase-like methyltransferase